MILTITPNTSLDRVLFLDRLERGRRNQVRRAVDAMGGKGTDVSLILAALGAASVAMGFIAGETGARIEAWLRDAGVCTAFDTVAGESRLNTVLIERHSSTHTTLCAEGLRVRKEDLASLTERAVGAVGHGDIVVLAGSVPDGVPSDYYARMIPRFHELGARVILDSSGASLGAGAAALPWALKPNREELETLAGRAVVDRAAAAVVAGEWVRRGVKLVLASLGAEGLVAVDAGGTWYAAPLDVPVVNPAGAGDAVVAAMAMGAARGDSTREIARAAAAAAAAVVMTVRTAECHRADYERLLPLVEVSVM